jgi:hypothetical protein
MFGEKIAHDLAPCGTDLLLIQALGEPKLADKLLQPVGGGNAAFATCGLLRQTPPFFEHSSANFPGAHQRKGLRGRGGRDRGIREGTRLFAVVANGFDWATLFRLFAESLLFRRLRLLVDVAVAAVIVAREIRGRSLAAKVAVDALIVHEVFAGDILRILVC